MLYLRQFLFTPDILLTPQDAIFIICMFPISTMVLRKLTRLVFWYTLLAGGSTTFLVFLIGWRTTIPIGLLGLLLAVPAWLATSFLLPTETGIETAEAGAAVGFISDDPTRTQISPISFPGRFQIGLYFLGLGLGGVLLFASTIL